MTRPGSSRAVSDGVRAPLAEWRDALRDSDLDSTARLAGFVISTYANASGLTFVGKELIAAGIAARSIRTADEAVNRLERAGYLHVTRPLGGRPNRYLLTLPTPQSAARCTPQLAAGYPAAGRRAPRSGTADTPQLAAPESVESDECEAAVAPPEEVRRLLTDRGFVKEMP